jgi:plasmid maintenance system antidote protein VapI
MNKRYEEIMDSVDELREKLLEMIVGDAKSMRMIAGEIGIGPMTLARLIKTDKPVTFTTICKVKRYIEGKDGK